MDCDLDPIPYINYESIIIAPDGDSHHYNAACLGVHFTKDGNVYLHVYDDTDSRRILVPGTYFSINFSDSFTDYVIAALRGENAGSKEPEFSNSDVFRFRTEDMSQDETLPVPILKSSWAAFICRVEEIGEFSVIKCCRREYPNIRGQIVRKVVTRFPRVFNNRSMNLALEALILTTRIPLYKDDPRKFYESLKFYNMIRESIITWKDFSRFEEGFELMENYLLSHGVSLRDLYEPPKTF